MPLKCNKIDKIEIKKIKNKKIKCTPEETTSEAKIIKKSSKTN